MKKIKEHIKEILKEVNSKNAYLKNLKYTYYSLQGDDFVFNEDLNKEYSNNRTGFERFKNNNKDYSIQYSGEISLRKVFDNQTNLVGMILEEKNKNQNFLFLKEKYEEIKKEFIKEFNVQDLDSFEFYLEEIEKTELLSLDFNSSEKTYIYKIKNIYNIIENIEKDTDFKKYFLKIIS